MWYYVWTVAAKRKRPKGINRETYDGFVDLCREGVSAREAAEIMGTARKTSTRAYNKGWPNRGWRAAKQVIAEEKLQARAALQEAQEAADREKAARDVEAAYAAQEAARKQVVRVRKDEATMVSGARGNVIALVAVTGRTLRSALTHIESIEAAIRDGVDTDGKQLTAAQRVDMLWKLGRLVKLAGDAGYDVIRSERLLLGEPTEIIGHRDLDSVTEEQAIAELKEAGEVGARMERRRKRRLLLLQGGKATDDDTTEDTASEAYD